MRPNIRVESTDRGLRPNVRVPGLVNHELHGAMGIRVYTGHEIDPVNVVTWAVILVGVCAFWLWIGQFI